MQLLLGRWRFPEPWSVCLNTHWLLVIFSFALIAITLVLPHSIEMRLIISNDSFHTKSFFAYEAFEVLENKESVKLS